MSKKTKRFRLKIYLFTFIFFLSPLLAEKSLVEISADMILGNQIVKNVPTDGTPHILNILRNGNDLSKSHKNDLRELGFRFEKNSVSHLRNQRLSLSHETEHFLLHYEISGSDAVDTEDLDADGIPDYVNQVADVFTFVRTSLVDSMTYDPPPTDGMEGGSDKYDIYISNLPSQYYGLAYTTSGATDDNACASYIEIRNNYDASWFQDNTELDNIKVTAAHEFYHAIQFGYDCSEEIWLMESTAVWAEDQIYDEINDCYRYMNSWFNSPHKSLNDASNWYGSFIFFQYISEHLGGAETIHEMWNLAKSYGIQSSPNDIATINDALLLQNSSFESALVSMSIANRLMTSNPSAGIYTYEEANDYPINSVPNSGTYLFSGEMVIERLPSVQDFSSRYFDIQTTEPLIVSHSGNTNEVEMNIILSLNNGDVVVRKGPSVNIDPEIGIDWISAVVTATSSASSSYVFDLKLSQGYSEDFSATLIYPNPFTPSAKNAYATIDLLITEAQRIQIEIYDLLGRKIQSWEKRFSEPQTEQYIWTGKNAKGNKVSSGIYFVRITGKEKIILQKVTVLR
jgi:hypothetical protein